MMKMRTTKSGSTKTMIDCLGKLRRELGSTRPERLAVLFNFRNTHPEPLFHLCITRFRRPGKSEENDFLAGFCADVMVHGQYFDTGDLLDHRLHDWTGRFDQAGTALA